MPRRLPPGCVEDCDRHGNIRIYFRVRGKLKVRLRGMPWSPDFMAQLDRAKAGTGPATQAALRQAHGDGYALNILVSAPTICGLISEPNVCAAPSLKARSMNR
jgi:hypothetical protein